MRPSGRVFAVVCICLCALVCACGTDVSHDNNHATNNTNSDDENNAINANNDDTNNGEPHNHNNHNNAQNHDANNTFPGDDDDCIDTDRDGLCDDEELALGTDPDNPDTDGDGFWDGWEHHAGTDPLDPTSFPAYYLPEGQPYALKVTSFTQPQSLAGFIGGQVGSVPPVLLYIDNLLDGIDAQELTLVGGVGEQISPGIDEISGTHDDVFAMHYGSISQLNGEYQVRLSGSSTNYELVATADTFTLDLGGFSSVTSGVRLRIDEVELIGTFSDDLKTISDITLNGLLSDQGLDELLEAVRDFLPLSKEQAMRLLDPDNTGIIPVEMGLSGYQVIVDGFVTPSRDVQPDPRIPGDCCPDGALIGDPIYPYLVWEDQGIQDDERDIFQLALQGLQQDPHVALIATAMKDSESDEIHYFVYSGGAMVEGEIVYRRLAGNDGLTQTYEIISQSGTNPLANIDPKALASYEAFLDSGVNPNEITYHDQGYFPGDPRLAFIPVQEMYYPFAYERIAQNFDDPRTGDLFVLPASYATGGFGNHGHLGSLQSRSPLLISGPGIRHAQHLTEPSSDTIQPMTTGQDALLIEDAVKVVDIAPTVAAALGINPTTGVGPDGRFRNDIYLKWQDGRVLSEIFTPEALLKIENGEPVADYAIILVNDGLTNIELLFQALSSSSQYAIDAYQELIARGVAYRYGSITNYPSNTYPSHNVLGSGAWAGHHGIVDNYFWHRGLGSAITPIRDVLATESLVGSAHPNMPVETLHEAVIRTFGDLSQGVLTASINEPSTRGAEFATLERRFPEGFNLSDDADAITIGDAIYTLPPADITDYGGVMDNASLATFAQLFTDQSTRDDGLPIPKYSIINFGSTDVAGHAHGPHGDQERDVVIGRLNERLGILFELLKHLDIYDRTMIVLTSDHGMELQDQSRGAFSTQSLNTAGIAYRHNGSVYFKQLATQTLANQLQSGNSGQIQLKVYDSDTRWGPELLGVEGVVAQVVSGGQATPAVSDSEGLITLDVQLDAESDNVLLEFIHADWTHHRKRIDVD